MIRRVRRGSRRREAGVSLIEAVVTVGIVSASVVTLVGALSAAEKNAGMETRHAQVQVALRTLGDDLSNNTLVSYNRCTVNGTAYRNQLNAAPLRPPGVTVTSVVVERPTVPGSGTRLSSNPCGGSRRDYGIQRLTLTATTGADSGSVVVWKSELTVATPAPTPTPNPGPGGGGGGGGNGGPGGGAGGGG